MKRTFLLLVTVALTLSSCKVGRFIYWNFADINDNKKFPARAVNKDAATLFHFDSTGEKRHPTKMTDDGKELSFDAFLEKHKTVAFLIIQNDTIRYENYFKGYNKSKEVPSFSVAKSVMSILVGCAIEDGYIKSVEQPVTDFIPELKENGFSKVKIIHLLQMTSGIKFNEGYVNPFGHAASYYYGRNLKKAMKRLKLEDEPGEFFNYISGNTQLLGWVLERALKDQSISGYLSTKLWQPLGMEYDASWSLDKKEGMEKTFCCINAVARDYAKIGRLYLNNGQWDGEQIVPKDWVTKTVTPNNKVSFYNYSWWMIPGSGSYYAHGILGQYIYVNPEKNLIIIRLGSKEGDMGWAMLFEQLSDNY